MTRSIVLALVAATTVLATSWLVLRGVEALAPSPPETHLDAMARLLDVRDAMARSDAGRRIAFMGDSTAIGYPAGRRVPDRLAQMLGSDRPTPTQRLFTFAQLGLGPAEQVGIASLVAAGAPDVVVLCFNLTTLAPGWERPARRPEVIGWVPAGRLPRALALLLETGATFDRLLGYVAIVRGGGFEAWRWTRSRQAAVEAARPALLGRLGGPVAEAPAYLPGQSRGWFTARAGGDALLEDVLASQYEAVFGGVSRERLSLRLLDETLEVLRASGASVIVYVAPMNVAQTRPYPFHDDAGLARSLASLRGIVADHGGRLLDLHDALPDAGFRDVGGHFALAPVDGPLRVARALADALALTPGGGG